MSEHEFRSSEPVALPNECLKPGARMEEPGTYRCATCAETVVATLITMEKDQALPVCHTCGPMTEWVKQR